MYTYQHSCMETHYVDILAFVYGDTLCTHTSIHARRHIVYTYQHSCTETHYIHIPAFVCGDTYKRKKL